MGLLGKLFLKLMGVKSNNPYIELIRRADEDDLIPDELFRLSMAYQSGTYGLPLDEGKALEYCQKAAEQNHVVAQLFMVQWLMRYPQDASPEVLKWLERAAMQGERQACFNYAISIHRGDYPNRDKEKDSLSFFRKSAEFRYTPAMERLAVIYYNGEGVEANAAIAKYWAMHVYTDPSNTQDKSQSLLLQIIDEEDTKIDEKGQRIINFPKIINEGAQAGERDAILQKGLHEIASQNTEEGLRLLHKATVEGHPAAPMFEALDILSHGNPDYQQCKNLFEISAKEGVERSQYHLARLYGEGSLGEVEMGKCWYWLEKSLNLGYKYARAYFSELYAQNKFGDMLPDKVLRAHSYAELAKME